MPTIDLNRRNIILAAILLAAGIGLYYGWKLFWFRTDDAYIAFRYVRNSILGHGYVWNAPPFLPVEGYTSFLWVAILDVVWRLFGVEPPQSANVMSLGFSYLTLLLIVGAAFRMQLNEQLSRWRLLFISFILLGTLTNRTFLAWTSSGLETALFNFCFTLWIVVAAFGRANSNRWLAGISIAAVLVYLTRPDGLLIAMATLFIIFKTLSADIRLRRFSFSRLAALSPLVLIGIHLSWRRLFYGEWLPNTYYAKYVSPWPESGVRYFGAFALEYALWVWVILLAAVLLLRPRKTDDTGDSDNQKAQSPTQAYYARIVVATVVFHVMYYTLIIGGDHFEFRVYAYLIPLIFLTFLWMLNAINAKPLTSAIAFGLFILLSLPVPWTHWALTKDFKVRTITYKMRYPVAPSFPTPFQWYAKLFDDFQDWTIDHYVGTRHQSHKVFCESYERKFFNRTETGKENIGPFPVYSISAVGVPAWTLPDVAIIDRKGLNDYVVARYRPPSDRERVIAHERYPPQGYSASFSPNVDLDRDHVLHYTKRRMELTAEDIIETENFWIETIVKGNDVPIPKKLPLRQALYFTREQHYNEAFPYLELAVELNPDHAEAHSDLGYCLLKQDKNDSALIVLTKANQLQPDNPTTLSRLGSALLVGDKLVEGEQMLLRALDLDSSQADALVELAALYVLQGKTTESRNCFDKLTRIEDTPPGYFYRLGSAYESVGHQDHAMAAYILALERGLNDATASELVKIHPDLKPHYQPPEEDEEQASADTADL